MQMYIILWFVCMYEIGIDDMLMYTEMAKKCEN